MYVPVHCAGAETHLHSMLSALAGAGHDVNVVLSRQGGPAYEFEGVKVWPAEGRPKEIMRWVPSTDVLVSHLENTPRVTFLGAVNDIPVVIVNHNTFAQSKEWVSRSNARCDLVVVNSRHMHDDLKRSVGDRVPVAIVRPAPARPERFRVDPGDRVTLVNLRRGDGADQMTKGGEMFRALAERMPRTKFLGVTGAYGVQQELADLDNVEVVEHVPNHRMASDVFARTRVLLMPSSYESWGRVGSEALCAGIPVVASPTVGLVENLGDAGVFVEHDDVDGWEAALRKLGRKAEWSKRSAAASARADELAGMVRRDRAHMLGWFESLGRR